MTECFKMTISSKSWYQPGGGVTIKRFVCRTITTKEGDFVSEHVSESLTECIKKCLYDCWTVRYEYPDVFNTYPELDFTDGQTFADQIYAEKIRYYLRYEGYLFTYNGYEKEVTF